MLFSATQPSLFLLLVFLRRCPNLSILNENVVLTDCSRTENSLRIWWKLQTSPCINIYTYNVMLWHRCSGAWGHPERVQWPERKNCQPLSKRTGERAHFAQPPTWSPVHTPPSSQPTGEVPGSSLISHTTRHRLRLRKWEEGTAAPSTHDGPLWARQSRGQPQTSTQRRMYELWSPDAERQPKAQQMGMIGNFTSTWNVEFPVLLKCSVLNSQCIYMLGVCGVTKEKIYLNGWKPMERLTDYSLITNKRVFFPFCSIKQILYMKPSNYCFCWLCVHECWAHSK